MCLSAAGSSFLSAPFVKDGQIVIKNEKGDIIEICGTGELRIIGAHNLENAQAAAAIAYFAGIEPKVITEPCGLSAV